MYNYNPQQREECNILTDSIQTLMNSGSSNGGFTIPLLPWTPQQTNI